MSVKRGEPSLLEIKRMLSHSEKSTSTKFYLVPTSAIGAKTAPEVIRTKPALTSRTTKRDKRETISTPDRSAELRFLELTRMLGHSPPVMAKFYLDPKSVSGIKAHHVNKVKFAPGPSTVERNNGETPVTHASLESLKRGR